MNQSQTIIEISKEYLHFSSAHFTIFSATERESLHGHNFFVEAKVHADIGENGLAFDYNEIKTALKRFCDRLDERTLLPTESPYLAITDEGDYVVAEFANERLPFLKRDALTLPVANISVEALSRYAIEQLAADPTVVALPFDKLMVRISSGPGQWASAEWSRA